MLTETTIRASLYDIAFGDVPRGMAPPSDPFAAGYRKAAYAALGGRLDESGARLDSQAELESRVAKVPPDAMPLGLALVRLAFDPTLSPLAGNPLRWPFSVAYFALGGRMEQGRLLDDADSLRPLSGCTP